MLLLDLLRTNRANAPRAASLEQCGSVLQSFSLIYDLLYHIKVRLVCLELYKTIIISIRSWFGWRFANHKQHNLAIHVVTILRTSTMKVFLQNRVTLGHDTRGNNLFFVLFYEENFGAKTV
jgi:hypothetical protein